MASLTPEQRRVLRQIVQIGHRKGASPMELKAAVETGLVESNLRNLPGGDADSAGWRQERASLYPDPTNLAASISRFFDETRQRRGKYGRAGELAAAVQRPAAQYRGRYQQHSVEADSLLASFGAAPAGATSSTRTRTVKGFDEKGFEQAQHRQLLAQLLERRRGPRGSVLLRTGAISTAPVDRAQYERARQVTEREPRAGRGASSRHAAPTGRSPLFELFYDPLGGWSREGGRLQSVGPIGGHSDHVHLAAGPKTVDALGRLAQRMGLHVGENETFDHVDPVHTQGSYHYRDRAIDVSGTPKKMAAFTRRVRRIYGEP